MPCRAPRHRSNREQACNLRVKSVKHQKQENAGELQLTIASSTILPAKQLIARLLCCHQQHCSPAGSSLHATCHDAWHGQQWHGNSVSQTEQKGFSRTLLNQCNSKRDMIQNPGLRHKTHGLATTMGVHTTAAAHHQLGQRHISKDGKQHLVPMCIHCKRYGDCTAPTRLSSPGTTQ